MKKDELLKKRIEHIDITRNNVIPIVDAMGKTAFTARTIYRASQIYDNMLKEKGTVVFLTLAGSLISAGLKKAIG